jgi:hypothetical protein
MLADVIKNDRLGNPLKKISGKSGNHHGAQCFFSAIHVLLPEGNLMIAA